jgi:hypothetical protein
MKRSSKEQAGRITGLAIATAIAAAAIAGGSHEETKPVKQTVIESVTQDGTHNYDITQDEQGNRQMSGFWGIDTYKGSTAVAEKVGFKLDVLFTGKLTEGQKQINNEMVDNLTEYIEVANKDKYGRFTYFGTNGETVLRIPDVQAIPMPAGELGQAPNEPHYSLHLEFPEK